MHKLRFVERDGQKVLQELVKVQVDQALGSGLGSLGISYMRKTWKDAPTVKEEDYYCSGQGGSGGPFTLVRVENKEDKK